MLELELPRSLYDTLKSQANGAPVEKVIQRKLLQFASSNSTKPLVIDDLARQHLEKLLARNLTTADELVSAMQRALSVRIDNVEIPLTPYLLDRLKSRAIGVEFNTFLTQTIKRLLEEFVNLR